MFASNFNENSVAGAAGLGLRKADSKSIIPNDYNNLMPRFGFAWSPVGNIRLWSSAADTVCSYERITGGFANSLRQSPPFFRELQLNNLSDWNTFPRDIGSLPIPTDDDRLRRRRTDSGHQRWIPRTEFEALETQMVPPDLATPYTQQWSLNTQWEFMPNWLLDIGYVGTKGTKLLQAINANQPLDVDTLGFLPRAGSSGWWFHRQLLHDRERSVRQPPTPTCDVTWMIRAIARSRRSCAEDCWAWMRMKAPTCCMSNGNSIYHSLADWADEAVQPECHAQHELHFARSIDTYSDEGKYQVEHDQTRPYLNRGLSDFHRKHRFIMSWTLGSAVPREPLRGRLADLRGRHVPVRPAVLDHRRRFQWFLSRVHRAAAEPGSGRDA